jgi:hypothetical protein
MGVSDDEVLRWNPMGMLNKFRYLFQIGAAFICIILTACSSALGTTPNPTPSPAFNRVEVEQELVATLLDSILHDLRVYSIADMTLIVMSPVQGSQESPDWRMNIDDPLKAWWFDGDQLTEASDPQAAIEQFRQDYLTQDIYGLYDFGILSIAQDGQSAEVYRGYDCGFECHGTASYFTLERNDAGEWGDIGTGVTLIE